MTLQPSGSGPSMPKPPLEYLPLAWLDVLAVIAYARRHEEVLRLLVSYPAPKPRSTFNLLDLMALGTRVAAAGRYAEHSDPESGRFLCEASLSQEMVKLAPTRCTDECPTSRYDKDQWVSFDDPETIKAKVEFANQVG
jgi:hypothetical protein